MAETDAGEKDSRWKLALQIAGGAVALGTALYGLSALRRAFSQRSIRATAPGKVLLSGGYLVVFPPNEGMVLTTDARFTADICAHGSAGALKPRASDNSYHVPITVLSPQFDATFSFELIAPVNKDASHQLARLTESGEHDTTSFKPSYVDMSLLLALTLARSYLSTEEFIAKSHAGVRVKVLGDNSFYDQTLYLRENGQEPSLESMARLPPHLPVRDGAKNGLGSSACLVTSIVGAVLAHYGIVAKEHGGDENDDRRIVHHVAQLAHNVAQGKIGSGFDVSAAVYGPQSYRRSMPNHARSFLSKDFRDHKVVPGDLTMLIKEPDSWLVFAQKKSLPDCFILMLGCVGGGSETTGMVKRVNQWKDESGDRLWKLYERSNKAFMHSLEALAAEDEQELLVLAEKDHDEIAKMNTSAAKNWTKCRKFFKMLRENLKEVGKRSGTDIEPDVQTRRADRAMAIAGVIACGVPGAGGYDAIVALVVGESARQRVLECWTKSNDVLPLPVSLDQKGIQWTRM